ncbi:YARHG domain-containing protein [Bacillus sp. FJAT-44742]|uniref:YARHG domain-containing protein n=1 Tax=Bacillus sp. FJAT-44742 TaxID=2014005 RepID=UPI0018E1DDE0|nr:YARHG domain-containing protein [Bacillus sp. FJAT-44742]
MIDEDSIKPLFSLLQEHPSAYEKIEKEMTQQLAENVKGENFLFSLEEEDKGLFSKVYIIHPKSFFIKATIEGEKTSLLLNDKEINGPVSTSAKKEFGPFLPGLYVLEAINEEEFVTVHDSQHIELFSDEGEKTIELDVTGNFIEVTSNQKNVKLFANGKDTGVVINGTSKFGPVPGDGSLEIYGQKEISGRIVTSDPIVINKETSASLFIEEIEEQPTEKEVVTIEKPVYLSSNDFIFPDSHFRLISSSELRGLTKDQLRIARNEIYARNGYVFNSNDLRQYFSSKSWYVPNRFYDGSLNSTEKQNVHLIKSLE